MTLAIGALVAILVVNVLGAPPAADAQPAGKVPRLGRLSLAGSDAQPGGAPTDGIIDGLRELGYVQGRDFLLERRDAGGIAERLPELAAERASRSRYSPSDRHGRDACRPASNGDNSHRVHDG